MNRLATTTKRTAKTMPPIAARLDLADEGQRRLHDLIRRMHTGRWPLFKCLGMRQINGVLYEAVEWLRIAEPSFGVVTWRSDGLGMTWHEAETAERARSVLRARSGRNPGPRTCARDS